MVAACIEQGRAPPIARIARAKYEGTKVPVTHARTGEPLEKVGWEHGTRPAAYLCVFESGAELWLRAGLAHEAYQEAIRAYRKTWTLADVREWVPDVVRAWLRDAKFLGRTDGAPQMKIECLAFPYDETTPHYACVFSGPPAQPVSVRLNLNLVRAPSPPPPPPPPPRAEGASAEPDRKRRRYVVYAPPTKNRSSARVEKVAVAVAPAKRPDKIVCVPVSLILESPVAAYREEARRFEEEEAKVVYDDSWDVYDPDA